MRIGSALGCLASCVIATAATAHTIVISVPLTSDQTVPPVPMGETTGTGSATVIVDTHDGSTTIIGTAQGLTGPMTGAHLHGLAAHGETAGVLLTLNVSGSTFSGIGTLSAAQLDGLLDGLTYVDVHTAAFPNGELRGQVIVPIPPDVVVNVEMNGAQAVPPVSTPAHAEVLVTIDHAVEDVVLRVVGDVQGLLGTATQIHFHGPAVAGAVGPSIAQFNIVGGHFSGQTHLSEAQVTWLMNGQGYLRIPSSLFPAGEIRGQITPKIPNPKAPPCPGDLNDDKVIDGDDLTIVLGQWGAASPVADVNEDGTVDGNDLTIVLGGWGACPVAPSVLYSGPVEGAEFHIETVDGATLKTTGSGQISLRLMGTDLEGIYEIELSTASFTLVSVPVGPNGSGGISMRQDLTTTGTISGGSAFQVAFECGSHFPLLDELYPPTPPICTEESSSPGDTVEELWHGVMHGTVETIGEVLTLEGLLHLHVHKQRSGEFASVESNLSLTLPRKDYSGLERCEPADQRTSRKSVCVQPVFIGTGPADPTRTGASFEQMKATAELTWEQCCVEFEWLAPKYVDQSSFKSLELLAAGEGVDVWEEWRALLATEDPSGANECIEVFFVSTFADAGGNVHAAGDGVTFSPGTRSAKIVIADGAIVDCTPDADGVLAHQLGHACGVCAHPAQDATAGGTVMDPTGQPAPTCAGAHSTLVNGGQCQKMARGPLVKQLVPEVPCCQSPD